MNQESYEHTESNQRQHHNDLQHQEKMNNIISEGEYALFAQLRPKIYQDGSKWCVLYGDDMQIGIVGFGETPQKAVMDWNKKWYKSVS